MRIIRRKRRQAGIAIYPLIDVVLQLLIFFMLTSKFIVHTAHNIELPKSKSENSLKEKEIVVYFNKERKLFLDESDRELTESQLTDELRARLAEHENKTVVLFADFKVQFGEAIKVIDAIKAAGPDQFTITTTPAEPAQ